ncbi:dTDP-4-dehydrorhamnose 3,5-epimerase [Pseudonocardia nigra]|uniref:dTDP-4-dehydrorhamnose 3,5-epimerase n=1 Tax=Pseudonocardia nigra TaxID=1921578 RepID=UPI001C5F172D|nr:dTDP-4-dehydrorhamnose 3,5-epimerase [Pseudonocardia nigra]
MRVHETEIPGVLLFEPVPHRDERGWFSRTFDARAARDAGVDPAAFVQDSQSRTVRGALRGLHGRVGHGEAKLVRCSSGALFDVVVDARPDSPTFGRHETFRLDDRDMLSVYIPRGCLHGFQALTEVADACYRIDAEHDPAEDLAVRWDDPDLGIAWPLPVSVLSAKDRGAGRWRDLERLLRRASATAGSRAARR